MGRAFLSLYNVTADSKWLDRARAAADFIDAHFANKSAGSAPGFVAFTGSGSFKAEPDFDENVYLARFANLLGHETGLVRYHEMASEALRFACAPEVAKSRFSAVGALLLADSEVKGDPLHIAIVGGKSDPEARKLFQSALAFPCDYKQVDWIDAAGRKSIPDANIYPDSPNAAAYVCTHHACSAPVSDVEQLNALLARRTAR